MSILSGLVKLRIGWAAYRSCTSFPLELNFGLRQRKSDKSWNLSDIHQAIKPVGCWTECFPMRSFETECFELGSFQKTEERFVSLF